MRNIRKMSSHQPVDIGGESRSSAAAEEGRSEGVQGPAGERYQGQAVAECRGRAVPQPLEGEKEDGAEGDAEAVPPARLRRDGEHEGGHRGGEGDRGDAEDEGDHDSPHAFLPSGPSTVSPRACAASAAPAGAAACHSATVSNAASDGTTGPAAATTKARLPPSR